jgi:hypothetical protein
MMTIKAFFKFLFVDAPIALWWCFKIRNDKYTPSLPEKPKADNASVPNVASTPVDLSVAVAETVASGSLLGPTSDTMTGITVVSPPLKPICSALPVLYPFPGLARRDVEFMRALSDVASSLETNPNFLLAVMQVESGIDPQARNPTGGATGLIQFMPATAKALGTSTTALMAMSASEQMVYVHKYLKPFAGRLHSAGDCYMTVFYPAMLGRPDMTVIAKKGSKVYDHNAGLDSDKNGVLTVGDVKCRAEKCLAKYRAVFDKYQADQAEFDAL